VKAKLLVCLTNFLAAAAGAGTVQVSDADALRSALAAATPGTTILVAPGEYQGPFIATDRHGTAEQPIVLAAADPARPPVLRGRRQCLHLRRVSHLVLRGLVLVGASINGLNIDDGGDADTPSHHVLLDSLTVRDIGPDGNCDGIKLTGVDDFLVRRCTVERWGSGGSAVDMVGCHRGLFVECVFRHVGGRGASGLQIKGGSLGVIVYRCFFDSAGERAVNLGGNTGSSYFRPLNPGCEAKQIAVIGSIFTGSRTPLAFVGSDECSALFNTIYRPTAWVFRILQETVRPDFVRCRNGVFRGNLVVWRWRELHTTCGIGRHTAPETFRFEDNWWYCEDRPARSAPDLPVPERDGVVGRDPGLKLDGLATQAANAPDHGAASKRAAEEFAAICPKLAPWGFERARAEE
jgi:hypothetical protein